MKLTVGWKMALKIPEAIKQVEDATRKGMVDTIAAIAGDVIKGSPKITGHNRRSIAYKLEGKATRRGRVRSGEKPFEEGEPDLGKLEGAIYSTSGYGGFLETGTVKMPAQPYFKPALDKNIKNLPKNIKAHLA